MEPNDKMQEVASEIVGWIKRYADEHSIETLVVGISGGVDSSLTSTLCAMTGLKTVAVRMPIHQLTTQSDMSKFHASWLLEKFDNVVIDEKDLSSVFDSFKNIFSADDCTSLSLANTRSRLRMVTLYQIASTSNGIVVGTGNKVEDFGVGFYTKYGDGGVDISPIADLYKTEVWDLASFLGISREIVEAPPTDGLWDDGRTDEDQIGATYKELEEVMKGRLSSPLDDRQKEVLNIYNSFHKANQHKMDPIPVCKINR